MDSQVDLGLRPQAPPSGQYNLDGPSFFPLTGREVFRLTAVGSVANLILTASVRTLDQRGNVQYQVFTLPVTANRAISTLDYPIGDGFFLDVSVRATGGTPTEGQCWVACDLVIGLAGEKQKTLSLGYGYATASKPLFLPFGQNIGPLEGPGAIRSITGTTPGAGAEILETVPAGARWELLTFRFQLLTAVAVANRVKVLVLDDGANEYHRVESSNNQPASTTFIYTHAQGYAASSAGVGNAIHGHLPGNIRMGPGHRIRTVTGAIQAADQYSAVQYLVRELFEQ